VFSGGEAPVGVRSARIGWKVCGPQSFEIRVNGEQHNWICRFWLVAETQLAPVGWKVRGTQSVEIRVNGRQQNWVCRLWLVAETQLARMGHQNWVQTELRSMLSVFWFDENHRGNTHVQALLMDQMMRLHQVCQSDSPRLLWSIMKSQQCTSKP
jgi:hypothetical protein